LDSQSVLFIDSLTEQRTINAAYYSKLHQHRVKPPAVRTKRGSQLVKSVCLLHDNASAHRRYDNRNIGVNALVRTATPRL